MITQRIRAGDWVYYPLGDTKPHRVELSEKGRLFINIKHYRVYFSAHGKESAEHSVPTVFIATPASHKKLSEFYRTEFGLPYEQCTIAETLDMLFDKQTYVLLRVENGLKPYTYAVSRADVPDSLDGSTWVRLNHNGLSDMYVPNTGEMYPVDLNGKRIIMSKPSW